MEDRTLSMDSIIADEGHFHLLNKVLNDNELLEKFRAFLKLNFSEENLAFYFDMHEIKAFEHKGEKDTEKIRHHVLSIHEKYFKDGAEFELNLTCDMRNKVNDQLQEILKKETMEPAVLLQIFEDSLCQIIEMLKFDSVPKFLRSEPEVAKHLLNTLKDSNETKIEVQQSVMQTASGSIRKGALLHLIHLKKSEEKIESKVNYLLTEAAPWTGNQAQKKAALKKKEKLENFFGTQIASLGLLVNQDIKKTTFESPPTSPNPNRRVLRRSNSGNASEISPFTKQRLQRKQSKKLEKFFGQNVNKDMQNSSE